MNTRDVTETMQDWQKRATDAARNAGEATDKYVHENTWASIGIAVAVGCVVGYLLASRRD
jgi:ElaB/YqjD/DUF883 family membrane-anchored ribosome-binding protein